MHRRSLRHLNRYLQDSKKILDSWDAYSNEHTDLDGWPHDDHAYGRRQSLRDADTAQAFETVRTGAHHLLATAEQQLVTMPAGSVQTRWIYQLGVLQTALERLDALHEEWLTTRDSLPADAKPGTAVFDEALAQHHAECWSYLDDWAAHGHVLSEINTAARHAPSPLASPPTTRPAAAAAQTAPARR
ncbi:hypothetical protein [Streptomyces leeuwenhoekii]|uniref:Uncharacterized protein n=1 Tax=Streptomyces leeuwenhoekii TaxID=1437453 RepID=A0A0F7VYH4_STRLW|nr:hypothetical protein [Streptomyces leeuwenhoekii]CQR61861.1 Hypothetical Protein SCAB [Streptomyces leeuwenhoekii]